MIKNDNGVYDRHYACSIGPQPNFKPTSQMWQQSTMYIEVYDIRGPAKKTKCTRHLASKLEIITGQI